MTPLSERTATRCVAGSGETAGSGVAFHPGVGGTSSLGVGSSYSKSSLTVGAKWLRFVRYVLPLRENVWGKKRAIKDCRKVSIWRRTNLLKQAVLVYVVHPRLQSVSTVTTRIAFPWTGFAGRTSHTSSASSLPLTHIPTAVTGLPDLASSATRSSPGECHRCFVVYLASLIKYDPLL